MTPTTLVWFESDLRLSDHPALLRAATGSRAVLPVFVWDGGLDWADGAASRWWLHYSLESIRADLDRRGLPLIIRRGDPRQVIPVIAEQAGASQVVWNARPEPGRADRDRQVEHALRAAGTESIVLEDRFLHQPASIRTTSGGPYQVFTPFYRKLSAEVAFPLPLPDAPIGPEKRPSRIPETLMPGDLGLLPRIDWAVGLRDAWTPGEAGASDRLERFADHRILDYGDDRNRPDVDGTSGLSPHLHFGEITPAIIGSRLQAQHGDDDRTRPFLRQIYWREFAHHLLAHFPHTPHAPLKSAFAAMPWRDSEDELERWQRGRTGYPIVDAAMRELWHTGWMHNRARMVVASFLTKDLLISWTRGADWFRDTLVDADLANNTLGWQWTAGCGADAQPFFRVFNPVRQGERFDPDGTYVKRWIPELERVPARYVHAPWTAPPDVLAAAGVTLGRTYPGPMVDHGEARTRALSAYSQMSGG